MRYWFDTEFIEDGKTIELVSIGIVAEDGREFYAEVAGVDYSRATDWVKQNVIRHLWSQKPDKREGNIWIRDGGRGGLLSRQHIAGEIVTFCDPEQYGKPEFWGYYADYDWVVLCQLFGRMMDLPNNWPMYCRDIKQECDRIGNPRLPEQGKDEHHALADARWNRTAWEFLAERNALRAERAEAAMRAYLEAGRAWVAVLDGPRGDDWMDRVNAAERANMDAMKGMTAALAAASEGLPSPSPLASYPVTLEVVSVEQGKPLPPDDAASEEE